MRIDWLQIENVRNLTNVKIQPSGSINIITGPNASGKTTILEAIFTLSRAKSFRTPRVNEIIQHHKPSFLVTAGIRYSDKGLINTGIQRSHGKTVIHHNGATMKTISEQAKNIPLVLVTPDTHNLLMGAPRQRRHWLDWAMFHVEHGYLDEWKDYHKALRQRNNLLKNGKYSSDDLSGWEKVMTQTGMRITEKRRKILKEIEAHTKKLGEGLFNYDPDISLYGGWPENKPLADTLKENRETDRLRGHTQFGIHRADIEFRAGKHSMAAVCSRGQAKLFIVVLLIAQARVTEVATQEKSLYLMDDYAAEIDLDTRDRIIELFLNQKIQVFLTATEQGLKNMRDSDMKMFHVERGEVVKVVE